MSRSAVRTEPKKNNEDRVLRTMGKEGADVDCPRDETEDSSTRWTFLDEHTLHISIVDSLSSRFRRRADEVDVVRNKHANSSY